VKTEGAPAVTDNEECRRELGVTEGAPAGTETVARTDRRRQHSDWLQVMNEKESAFVDGETNKILRRFWIIEPLGGSISRGHAAHCAA